MWAGDFTTDYTVYPELAPRLVRFCRDAERGWLEEVDMAEMTELEQVKVLLADKQIAIEHATHFEQATLALLRGLIDGSIPLERLTVTGNTWSIESAAVQQAQDVAREAQTEV